MQRDFFRAPQVLIACEYSGIVRDAFLKRGFDAWSCDLKADDAGSNRHIRGDVLEVLGYGWDLIIVAHPPCTRLCNSGVRWLSVPPPGRTRDEMWQELEDGAAFFSALWNAPAPAVAIENPVMHKHAKKRIVGYREFSQSIQPWEYGEPQFKRTCLWLRGLPNLRPTDVLTPPAKDTAEHRMWSRVHRMPPGAARGHERSRFFPGIAAAMAEQWGGHVLREQRKAA